MTLYARWLTVCLLSITSFQITSAQSRIDSISTGDTTFIFRDDTLFSNKGFNIFVGQHLIAGRGSDEEGRYRAISFRSPFAFPLWFMRETELKNDPAYSIDPYKRDGDMVKGSVDSGRSFIVMKIRSEGRRKKWHYYLVFLSDGRHIFPLKLRCNIILALQRKEILLG